MLSLVCTAVSFSELVLAGHAPSYADIRPESPAAVTGDATLHTDVYTDRSEIDPERTSELRQIATDTDFDIGAQAVLSCFPIPEYTALLSSSFNTLLIDGELGWGGTSGLRPGPGAYNFDAGDAMIDFADLHNMKVQVHHLVWGHESAMPGWLTSGGYTSSELAEILEEHVRTVVRRYRGRVDQYSVVNEALYGHGYIRNLWYEHLGPEYVEMAFRWAHEEDPSAVLILNDNNNEVRNDQSDHMYDLVAALKARQVPIKGIGMQMHLDGARPPTKDDVLANMTRFGDLGVSVYVTEFDVDMSHVPGSDLQRRALQAAIYRDMMEACIESGVCRSFVVFGVSDRYSWYYDERPRAEPLLFDEDYQPKDAYWAVRESLSKQRISGLTTTCDCPTTPGRQTLFQGAVSGGASVAYHWDLGDGLLASGQTVAHSYEAPGIYTATLTAVSGLDRADVTMTVIVHDPPQGDHAVLLPLVMRITS